MDELAQVEKLEKFLAKLLRDKGHACKSLVGSAMILMGTNIMLDEGDVDLLTKTLSRSVGKIGPLLAELEALSDHTAH